MRVDICRMQPFRGCKIFIFSKKPRAMHKINSLILQDSDTEMDMSFAVQNHLL